MRPVEYQPALAAKNSGFTLIEVLVTMGIVITLFSLAAVSLRGSQTSVDTQALANQLASDIKSQQTKAMSGETNNSATQQDQGIIFTTNSYELFSSGSACEPTGSALYEKYDGIGGTAISALYGDPDFPNNPSSTQTMNGINLSSPINIDDNFGGRLSALICPPETGLYIFYVTGDDETELRLSNDTSPGGVSVIASVPGWSPVDNWSTYSQQTSAPVNLQVGQYYYIEANYKEGSGGDHAQIGWQLPGGTQQRPIPSSVYSLPSETGAVSNIGSGSFSVALPSSITLSHTLPDDRLSFEPKSGEVNELPGGGIVTITLEHTSTGESATITINQFGAITVSQS